MTENKRYTKEVIDTDLLHYVNIKDNGFKLTGDEVVDLLNEQEEQIKQQEELISEQSIQLDYLQDENKHMKDVLNENSQLKERIKELEIKLNQTALELLNYEMITMGKAVEISEMSYIDFLKYRKEHENPMELQL